MRLSRGQSGAIVAATTDLPGADAGVRLFGSRLRDDVLGGDIDLFAGCPKPVTRPVHLAAQITARLQRALGNGETLAELGTSKRRYLEVACSDEATALTAGTSKITFRMPRKATIVDVRAQLNTAQSSGSIFTVDINDAGTSILSTKLTIDNAEQTSTTAATPAVISDPDTADDAQMSVDIDQVGDGTAKGLKVIIVWEPA